VFASSKFKKFVELPIGDQYKYYRVYYTVFALASFAAIMIYLFLLNSHKLFASTTGTIVSGILMVGAGIVIMIICILKYFMQVSGIKGLLQDKMSNELMITGIHKVVRHPLYAGTFIFIWGLFILFPSVSLLISDAIITIYTLVGLRFEERKLEREFGEAYKVYRQKVPMIIPKLIR